MVETVDDTMWEGTTCVECQVGTYEYDREDCSCHISPPCVTCVDAVLECDFCGDWPPNGTPKDEKVEAIWEAVQAMARGR
jgi:hypothetical protein